MRLIYRNTCQLAESAVRIEDQVREKTVYVRERGQDFPAVQFLGAPLPFNEQNRVRQIGKLVLGGVEQRQQRGVFKDQLSRSLNRHFACPECFLLVGYDPNLGVARAFEIALVHDGHARLVEPVGRCVGLQYLLARRIPSIEILEGSLLLLHHEGDVSQRLDGRIQIGQKPLRVVIGIETLVPQQVSMFQPAMRQRNGTLVKVI